MAATIQAPVSRPARPRHPQFPALIAAGAALLAAVTVTLIFLAVSRGLAPAPGGHRTGTPVVVPHPAPGPFGS
jgi:hypothetical protein